MTVYDLTEGQSAMIKSIMTDSYTCKLLTLGLLPQSKVTYIRSAPIGGARYLLTGLRQHVSNFPGVTVDKKIGVFQLNSGEKVDLIDLPR